MRLRVCGLRAECECRDQGLVFHVEILRMEVERGSPRIGARRDRVVAVQ
jgi:hypothetical protein